MNYEAIIEGILFISGEEGLSKKEFLNILEINEIIFLNQINNLINYYKNNDRGFEILTSGDIYKLVTKKEHYEYYKKMALESKEQQLSSASLEVLAIVAYNQPITRVEVDEIRGVSSSHIFRKLLFKGLIKDIGKSEKAGRPTLYKTTDKFLDYFKLENLDNLPNLDEISVNTKQKQE